MNKNTTPRNVRNNNPLNIRRTNTKWQGMSAEQHDKSFCQFNEMKYGWRAAFILLCKTYYEKRRLRTVREIISTWAPDFENNTSVYIKRVSAWADVEQDSELPSPRDNEAIWMRIAYCMACVEGGFKPKTAECPLELQPLVEGWMLYEEYRDAKRK